MKIETIKQKMTGRPPAAVGGRRCYSVLIPLVESAGGPINPNPQAQANSTAGSITPQADVTAEPAQSPQILYEVRAAHMKAQPGDVCFPGGRIEEGESPLECALRETWEEIGIGSDDIDILGQFDTMYEISNITMYTFVGVIKEESLKKINLNPDEVDRIFTVPYDFFSAEEPLIYQSEIVQDVEGFPYEESGINPDYKWRRGKNIIPIYKYEGHTIWGLTGRLTKWFVEQMSDEGELHEKP